MNFKDSARFAEEQVKLRRRHLLVSVSCQASCLGVLRARQLLGGELTYVFEPVHKRPGRGDVHDLMYLNHYVISLQP